MTFSSISFIYLYLPLAIIIFRLTPAHRRVACLTLLSWCYYLLASVPAALILAANCLLDFVLLSFLELYLARCPDKPVGYLAFAAKAVVVQVLVMAYSHWSPGASLGGFVYTATLIGYLWDHSRGKAGYFRSFWDYALFTTFFAKSYLGPVVRYDRFVPQFSQLRSSATLISRGAVQFVIGLAKKGHHCERRRDPLSGAGIASGGGVHLLLRLDAGLCRLRWRSSSPSPPMAIWHGALFHLLAGGSPGDLLSLSGQECGGMRIPHQYAPL